MALVQDHHQAAVDFYADDVVLRISGRHRFAGEFRGRPAVVAAMQALAEVTGGTIGPEVVRSHRRVARVTGGRLDLVEW
jgi:hypothetical protein